VIWAVASGKGAPGVTTLTALLASSWPDLGSTRVVIEADPDGGVLAARWHAVAGLTHQPGLLSLAASRDGTPEERLHEHAQPIVPGVELVAGPPGSAQADACLRALGEAAPQAIAGADVPVFVDCGRLHPASPALPWARAARRTLLVVRPRLEEVVAIRSTAGRLTAVGVSVALVCIGDRPFAPAEVAAHAELPLLGIVADDPSGASLVAERGVGDRRFHRTGLARTVRPLAEALAADLDRDVDPTDAHAETMSTGASS
jgi:hypothetical protein